jgi:hypothetical protein
MAADSQSVNLVFALTLRITYSLGVTLKRHVQGSWHRRISVVTAHVLQHNNVCGDHVRISQSQILEGLPTIREVPLHEIAIASETTSALAR